MKAFEDIFTTSDRNMEEIDDSSYQLYDIVLTKSIGDYAKGYEFNCCVIDFEQGTIIFYDKNNTAKIIAPFKVILTGDVQLL